MMRIIILVIFVATFFSSCHKAKNEPPINAHKFEAVLYDYHLSLLMARASADSTEYKEHLYTHAALAKHGVSQAEFDSSLVWYAIHTEQLYTIYEKLQKRLEREALALGADKISLEAYANISSEGDTANIWNGATFYLLTSNGLNKRMTFSVVADSSFKANDKFIWHFTPHFVYRSGARDAIVNLKLTYVNDSMATVSKRLYSDDDFEISIDANGTEIKQISGFVYHRAEWDSNEKLLFIFSPTLIRCHQSVVETDSTDTATTADTLEVAPESAKDTLLPLPKHRMEKMPELTTPAPNSSKFKKRRYAM